MNALCPEAGDLALLPPGPPLFRHSPPAPGRAPAGLRATWAEAPPLPRPPETLAGSGAEAVLQERREDLGCSPGNGDECQPAVRDDEVERQPLTVVRHIHS